MPDFDTARAGRRLELRSRIGLVGAVFQRYLDVSTGHMTLQDSERLARGDDASVNPTPVIWENLEHGWLVFTSDYLDDEESCKNVLAGGFSEGFLEVLQWARFLDCYGVRFDSEGERYGHLKTYDW